MIHIQSPITCANTPFIAQAIQLLGKRLLIGLEAVEGEEWEVRGRGW